jgi:apolipoprotein N-acyltransferase
MTNAIAKENVPKQGKMEMAHPASRSQLWWLLAAGPLLLVADGRNTIALAAWLAPACLLRYVRGERRVRGLVIAYLVLVVMRGVAYRGMTPIPGVFYYVFMVISGVSALLPYMADRLLAVRMRGLQSTLIFPCTLVAAQFIYSHGPHGSWGTLAYTQAGNLPLLQLLSVTGLWGVTFLIGWFAAVVTQSLEQPRDLRPLGVFTAGFLAVMLGGGARLAFFRPASPTVRVASLSPAKDAHPTSPGLLDAILAGRATDAEVSEFRSASVAAGNDLLARSEREAAAGAKIIFWSEMAVYTLAEDEPALLAQGRALAARDHLYLGMALGTWSPGARRPMQNKLVLIEPTGRIAWQYLKARPTPGPEAAAAARSDGKLRFIDTPYGRILGAICYDTDFPSLMAQAGASGADVVLSPAGDWRAIDPRHTEIASFRAMEQGFNLVRQSNGGLSAAYDYQGRSLGQMDHYQASELSLVAQVPTRGVRTLYARTGDWFAWLCIGTLLVLAFVSVRYRKAD